MMSIAVDPQFETNHYIYLYYTFKKYGICPYDQPEQPGQPRVALRLRRRNDMWTRPARSC